MTQAALAIERMNHPHEIDLSSMPPLTVTLVFRCLAWLLVLAITVVTVSPIGLRLVTEAPAHVERLVAFLVVGGAFSLGYPRHRLQIALLAIGVVALLEAAQNLVPGRHSQVLDGLVKAAGALLGVALGALMDWRVRRSKA
jgi:hypothetical protein